MTRWHSIDNRVWNELNTAMSGTKGIRRIRGKSQGRRLEPYSAVCIDRGELGWLLRTVAAGRL